MKVIVAAGGTGGHIYPALAIINKIKAKEKDSKILYIGTTDRMEKDIVPKMNIDFIGLEMAGFNRKNIFKNFSVLHKLRKAYLESKKIIKEFDPDIVIGAGGYISAPVLCAAHKLKYKTVIHEQNSIPGMSNKFLAKFSDAVFLSFPNSKKYFPNAKTIYTGNPRSEEIVNVLKFSKEQLGFKSNKKLVLFVMGSLGSTTMTLKIKQMIPSFKDKDYQVLIVTGKTYYDDYKELKLPRNVKVVPFLDNLINIMKDTDLIISRAGASTIAEITAIGLASILVPSPYVTHNHQYLNALELEENGACKMILEKDFDGSTIIPLIDEIINNKVLYEKLKKCSWDFGVRNSATMIYEEIRKLIG